MSALVLRAVLLFLIASACAGTGSVREPETRAERLEFERDRERCVLQAEDHFGVLDPDDYRACMRARGWSAPPE